MENRILSACLTRNNYEQILSALDGDSFTDSFSPIAKTAAKLLEDFYTIDPTAVSCSREALLDRAEKESHNPHLLKAIQDFCRGLDGAESLPNVVHDLRVHRRHRVGDQIAGLLANRAETRELDELIQKYQALRLGTDESSSDDGATFHNVRVATILGNQFSADGTTPFGLGAITRACDGGARPGHHILICGRPEIGKSLLAIDLTVGWIGMGHRTLYIENEEPVVDTTLRVIGRICRRTRSDIRQYPEKAQEKIESSGYDNFISQSLAPGNFPQIGRLVDKYQPRIVVINQLRNIDVGDDNRVTALEKAAIGARNLAKQRGLIVVSVTQAGESAEGKTFLELSDIDFSKTGIPGAIDLFIGIGASADDKRFGIRGISLAKNKLGGDHAQFCVKINPQTGEVEEFSR